MTTCFFCEKEDAFPQRLTDLGSDNMSNTETTFTVLQKPPPTTLSSEKQWPPATLLKGNSCCVYEHGAKQDFLPQDSAQTTGCAAPSCSRYPCLSSSVDPAIRCPTVEYRDSNHTDAASTSYIHHLIGFLLKNKADLYNQDGRRCMFQGYGIWNNSKSAIASY